MLMHQFWTWVFEPGFFSSDPVHVAVVIGAVAAVVSAVIGVFTVMRGQSFAGHALGDVSAAGGSGALLAGLNPLLGFVGLGIFGAGVMDMIGVQRVRGRDLATGIVLGAAIGLSALFLYLDTATGATTGATQQILFGSIFSTLRHHPPRGRSSACYRVASIALDLPAPAAEPPSAPISRRPAGARSAWSACCTCSRWPSRSGCRPWPSAPSCRRPC